MFTSGILSISWVCETHSGLQAACVHVRGHIVLVTTDKHDAAGYNKGSFSKLTDIHTYIQSKEVHTITRTHTLPSSHSMHLARYCNSSPHTHTKEAPRNHHIHNPDRKSAPADVQLARLLDACTNAITTILYKDIEHLPCGNQMTGCTNVSSLMGKVYIYVEQIGER